MTAGITPDGVSTSKLPMAARFDTGVNQEGRRIINSIIANIYDDFVTLVASRRGKTWEEINGIAGGRVWSGEDALGIGLVDALGACAPPSMPRRLVPSSMSLTHCILAPHHPEQQLLEQLGRELGQVYVPGVPLWRGCPNSWRPTCAWRQPSGPW